MRVKKLHWHTGRLRLCKLTLIIEKVADSQKSWLLKNLTDHFYLKDNTVIQAAMFTQEEAPIVF